MEIEYGQQKSSSQYYGVSNTTLLFVHRLNLVSSNLFRYP